MDTYCLGVLLFFMYTFTHPYASKEYSIGPDEKRITDKNLGPYFKILTCSPDVKDLLK